MTNSERKRLSSVMMSSVMPSEKYSCSGSPLILVKGSTAIDGLSGRPSSGFLDSLSVSGSGTFSPDFSVTAYTATGSSKPFTTLLPRLARSKGSRLGSAS